MRDSSNKEGGIFKTVRNLYNDHILLANTVIGGLLGYLTLYPLVMVITRIMHYHVEQERIHLHTLYDAPYWIALSFKPLMLPWAIAFTGIGMIIGLFYGSLLKKEKSVQKELMESEEKQRALFDSSLDGVYETDAKGVFTRINKSGAKILGHDSPRDLIGKPALNYWVNPKDRESFRKELKRKKSLNAYPITAKRADGEKIFLENTARILESDDTFFGIEGILRDVTARKKAEADLKRYSEELRESDKFKDLFTDIMRHDILNPTGIIKNVVELGLESTPGDEGLELALESALRIQDIVDNASRLSKIDHIKDFKKEELDLKKVIDAECEHCISTIQNAGMELENKVVESMPMKANPMIREIILNLITNATKYASEGKKVIIEAEDAGENYKITVKDYGPGIPDELKERIFDRFKRKEKTGIKGTGLGLAIVKRLVELHSGKVWVEDNPDGGSVFAVEIPKNGGVDDG